MASVLLPVPVLLSTAQASPVETVNVPVSQASWFWRGQLGVIGTTGVALPVAVADPSVPGGDLAVSGPTLPATEAYLTGPVAETYLAFDVSEIPVGSTITSFKISLPVDSRGITAQPLGATLVACASKSSWSSGFASPYSGKPADDCDSHAPHLKAGPGGHSYSVDIADIAQRWVRPNALNLGVAITDDPGNTITAYQIVFGPGAALQKLTASVTFRPPGTGSAGPIVAGDDGGATPPADGVTASTAPGLVSVVPVGPLPIGLPPAVATQTAPSVQPAAPVVAAQVSPADPSAPPMGFWFALVLIVLLLGTTTFVLADPNVALGGIADRGVARALRARRIRSINRQEST